MDIRVFNNKYNNLLLKNFIYIGLIAMLALINIYLVWIIGNKISDQKTVFIPPVKIDKEFWIKGDKVSPEYLQLVSQTIAFNVMNVDPKSVENNIVSILSLTYPEYIQQIKQILTKQYEYIIKNSIVRTFFMGGVDVTIPNVISINGMYKDIIGQKIVSSDRVSINVVYKIVQGRFYIVSIGTKFGEPR